jgi:hypothetical protein
MNSPSRETTSKIEETPSRHFTTPEVFRRRFIFKALIISLLVVSFGMAVSLIMPQIEPAKGHSGNPVTLMIIMAIGITFACVMGISTAYSRQTDLLRFPTVEIWPDKLAVNRHGAFPMLFTRQEITALVFRHRGRGRIELRSANPLKRASLTGDLTDFDKIKTTLFSWHPPCPPGSAPWPAQTTIYVMSVVGAICGLASVLSPNLWLGIATGVVCLGLGGWYTWWLRQSQDWMPAEFRPLPTWATLVAPRYSVIRPQRFMFGMLIVVACVVMFRIAALCGVFDKMRVHH